MKYYVQGGRSLHTDAGDDDNDEEPEQAQDADMLDEAGQVPCPRANAPYSTDGRQRKEKPAIINQWCAEFTHSRNYTSRKHAKNPPQKYQNEDEPVPILVPVHLGTGTFGWMGLMDEP